MSTVLIIDDSKAIRIIIRKALSAASLFDTFLEAPDGREGMNLVTSNAVDVVLCDLEMPILDGFGFVREFRADNRFSTIPLLMLSSTDSANKKVEGFALGATDYIVKPCDPAELCARVRSYLKLKVLQDEMQEKNYQLSLKNEELNRMAITDPLTGLHNRRYFLDRAEEEFKRASRHNREFSMLMMDIDFFKKINDEFGHPQGDTVLVTVAEALRSSLRVTDLLARFGGEEFAVCLPETPSENAGVAAEKLRSTVERLQIVGMNRPVTISIGVSSFPHVGNGVDELLKSADQALYRAKTSGRNRYCVAVPSSEARA